MRKRYSVVATPFVVAALGLSLAACSSNKSSGSSTTSGSSNLAPYNVALVGALTGTAVSTAPGLYGAEAAFDVINAAGGVNGHKINVTVTDDQSSPTVGATVGRNVVAGAPVAIVDSTLENSDGLVRFPIYQSASIPVMAINSTQQFYPWLYSAGPTNTQLGVALTNAAAKAVGGSLTGKKVALIQAAAASAEAAGTVITNEVKKDGGTVVSTQNNPVGAVSFSGAPQIISSGADVVISADTPTSTILEAKALDGAGYKGPIVVSYAASDDQSLQTMGTAGPAKVSGIRLYADGGPGTGLYKAVQKYKLPSLTTSSVYGGEGWAIGHMLAMALAKCAYPCSGPKLEQKLDSLGTFSIPGGASNNLQYGDLTVSKTVHNILTHVQLYGWDTASNSVTKVYSPVSVGPPGF